MKSEQEYKKTASQFLNQNFKIKERLKIIRDRIKHCEKEAEGLSGGFGGSGGGQHNDNSAESRIYNMMQKKADLTSEAEELMRKRDEAEKIVMNALAEHIELQKYFVNVYFFEMTIKETASALGLCESAISKNLSEGKIIIGKYMENNNISSEIY